MRVDVLYQFNEKYAPYAGVSITSLYENNKHIEELYIHLLAEKISPLSKARLINTAKRYGRVLYFLDTEELTHLVKELNIPSYRGSYVANLRMFVPMIIGEGIQRLLYLDSDTIITGDIKPVFSMDMDGKPLGMVLDSLGGKHKKLIGMEAEDEYFNSGVLLFELDTWKKYMCTEKIIEHVTNVRTHYMSPDQDILNMALKGMICRMDIKYNVQPCHVVFNYRAYKKCFWNEGYYEEAETEAAVNNPVIVHFFRFLGQFPWDYNSVHPDTELFDKYMEISYWKDYNKIPADQKGMVFKVERWLYKVLPKALFLIIFKINYDGFVIRSEKASRKRRNNKEM